MIEKEFQNLLAGCRAGNEAASLDLMALCHPIISGAVKFQNDATQDLVYNHIYDKILLGPESLINRFQGSYEEFVLGLKNFVTQISIDLDQDYASLKPSNNTASIIDVYREAERVRSKHRWSEVQAAIVKLPGNYRKLLELHMQGVPIKNIASNLSISESTSVQWLQKALKCIGNTLVF